MSTVLITGGAGAIGSNMARMLLERGHEVSVFDDLSSGRRELVPAGARFVEGTVVDDEALARVFGAAPEYVVHAAALFANQNSVDHPQQDLLVNGLGTVKVLEACVRAGVRKVLFCSSSCVYGGKELMVESDVDFRPDTPYAITKLLGERYMRFWAEHHALNTVIVRLFNTYGPHEHPGPYRNVIPNFLWRGLHGEPLVITGTGEETRDFNYVQDTVRGILSALFGDTTPGDVFNIGSGREVTILELAERVNAITGNPSPIEFRPRRDWDRVVRRRGDVTRASSILDYRPEVVLEEGLQRTCDWLQGLLR